MSAADDSWALVVLRAKKAGNQGRYTQYYCTIPPDVVRRLGVQPGQLLMVSRERPGNGREKYLRDLLRALYQFLLRNRHMISHASPEDISLIEKVEEVIEGV